MALTDMFAQRRARITADEEERMRLGYEVTSHYRSGGRQTAYTVSVGSRQLLKLTVEEDGQVLLVNHGQREREGEPEGFALCRKCHKWLVGRGAALEHVGDLQKRGQCPRNAQSGDLAQALWLTNTVRSDLALFDVPFSASEGQRGRVESDEGGGEVFYTTLLHTLLRALMVAFNLDEGEVAGFLAPPSGDEMDVGYRVVVYETAVGGSGVLASLGEPGRLASLFATARELLHEEDPEEGCANACYECLLSFYNQRVHELLDRTLVLPWLRSLSALTVEVHVDEGRFGALQAQCQSEFEREVLRAIRERGLRLPDEAQKRLYDGDEPIASADFFYAPKILIFVDGSPHYQEYVAAGDAVKRRRLKALGYRILAIPGGAVQESLDRLAQWLG
jgi:hypothetical protein